MVISLQDSEVIIKNYDDYGELYFVKILKNSSKDNTIILKKLTFVENYLFKDKCRRLVYDNKTDKIHRCKNRSTKDSKVCRTHK